jgi:UDP-N-acetylglucosamine 2-epimerase (non-hydrolysing)
MIKIICVCGARPNFMKIAPIMAALKAAGMFNTMLVHTGQHYDEKMSRLFFEELGIPKPDVNLEVGSGSHAVQTAEVMKRFEPLVLDYKPDYVLVVGDVNSTIACGLVAVKLGVKLIHVEAGLRSFDRSMPEEVNRVLTDSISDLLFVSEASGVENLRKEGIDPKKVHLVGNVMIDTLLANRAKAAASGILDQLGVRAKEYGVVTLHRPSNVDSVTGLEQIVSAFETIQKEMPLVFPIHPRTRKNLEGTSLQQRVAAMAGLHLIEPVGYIDFLQLTANAAVVITDSGGVQEETTILGVPCMTLRSNTERPVTIAEGTNRLVKVTASDIVESFQQLKSHSFAVSGRIPHLWDGKAAQRIAAAIAAYH